MNLYTIGALSRRTGVGISTLRAWERRHGFPVPQRVPSGHRRYTDADVETILEVVRARDAGVTLEAALARARARSEAPRSSIFDTVRAALPDVAPVALTKVSMLSVSRAIEDEAAARADDASYIGAFQAPRFWRPSRARWQHLANRARMVVAMATFRTAAQRGNVWEVPIEESAPLAREWAVVCDSSSFSACLAGLEWPGQDPAAKGRVFEAIWTVEPAVVREAACTAARLAHEHVPELSAHLSEMATASYDTVRGATALTNRVLMYRDAATPRRVRM